MLEVEGKKQEETKKDKEQNRIEHNQIRYNTFPFVIIKLSHLF